ncbi:unnamed protein product [Protopolystoma xenopodis]|uniref:Uncharacterized protein n=1 Tax=Protopolystoma xenopodis TaxID=117903 RepID=A0A3S4ZBG9_9PLAT|nr:unnamed protein product [Protopolystoma xenopodis]
MQGSNIDATTQTLISMQMRGEKTSPIRQADPFEADTATFSLLSRRNKIVRHPTRRTRRGRRCRGENRSNKAFFPFNTLREVKLGF